MIAKQLKELRARNKITQEDLAEALSLERSSIGKYESPTKPVTPPADVLLRIADYFHVSIDYLVGHTDDKKTPAPKDGDGLSPEQAEVINLYDSAPPAFRAAALALLRSAGEQSKALDGVSPAE